MWQFDRNTPPIRHLTEESYEIITSRLRHLPKYTRADGTILKTYFLLWLSGMSERGYWSFHLLAHLVTVGHWIIPERLTTSFCK